jgi:hypothetical protein
MTNRRVPASGHTAQAFEIHDIEPLARFLPRCRTLIAGASVLSISSIGSSPAYAYAGVSASTSSSVGEPSAKDEFLKFQSKSPAEKMRAMMLAKLGVTEEQLKAMPPEERKKIEDKLKDMVKEQVQNDIGKKGQTGLVADILA